MPGKRGKPEPEERKEEALRPSCFLGYHRDKLAVYLVSRKAYRIAETQFRRAIWLNPYEPAFKQHLAVCLYKDGRYREARKWITEALEQQSDNPENRKILKLIEQEIKD